jgi:hypothetical protein
MNIVFRMGNLNTGYFRGAHPSGLGAPPFPPGAPPLSPGCPIRSLGCPSFPPGCPTLSLGCPSFPPGCPILPTWVPHPRRAVCDRVGFLTSCPVFQSQRPGAPPFPRSLREEPALSDRPKGRSRRGGVFDFLSISSEVKDPALCLQQRRHKDGAPSCRECDLNRPSCPIQ